MEANLLLAKRAHQSAKRMEDMTQEMSLVAEKTKQETVSMKIITLVTLFFLPGTFISVRISIPSACSVTPIPSFLFPSRFPRSNIIRFAC
jgi:hypothetical protein